MNKRNKGTVLAACLAVATTAARQLQVCILPSDASVYFESVLRHILSGDINL